MKITKNKIIPGDPTPNKRKTQPSGRREYPSLDRLVASSTGTIPKRQSRTVVSEKMTPEHSQPQSPKTYSKSADNSVSVSEEQSHPQSQGKRHHRSGGSKSHQNAPGPSLRRKDIPAPPPPSPATYSDLQELKANMEGFRDDTKSRSVESESNESGAKTVVAKTKPDPPDISALELEDSDVFYDARSEDSAGAVLPSDNGSVLSSKKVRF